MKNKHSFLVIEDDKYTRAHLQELIKPYGVITEAPDFEAAQKMLLDAHFDVVITDIELGDGSGVDLIESIKNKGSYCIVVSSFECEQMVEKSYDLGAKHYLSKSKIRELLPVYIEKFINTREQKIEQIINEHFITKDQELIEDLKRLSEINWKGQSLFIAGPTGTGKSLLGKLIHEITHPKANLVHLNCSEVPENLIESELFGHEKGAFTGADQKKDGKLKLAHGGTLFLDEVATMPMSMQQKLLKALDEKTFYPVGSSVPVMCDFTLITATCENILEKMTKKEFREDFYHRISGFQFRLKPLSERVGDIELLVKHFQKKSPRRFVIKEEALEILKKHPWPGNIRELKKTIERFSQSTTGVITIDMASKLINPTKPVVGTIEEWESYILEHGLKSLISQIEKNAVEGSMKRNSGKITACIKELKISSSAFYRILQETQLQL